MQFDNREAAKLTERLMAKLCKANVLKPDEPNYPTHYNRAFSAIYSALEEKAATSNPACDVRRVLHDSKNITHLNQQLPDDPRIQKMRDATQRANFRALGIPSFLQTHSAK